MTSVKQHLLAAVAALALAAVPGGGALAGAKPKGAKATPPEAIMQLYAGKTSNWSRGGHAYWAPDGSFQGVNKTGDAVGIGKWYVTRKGKLCSEADWHKAVDGVLQVVSSQNCWQFVTAPDGTVWERYLGEDSNWYRHKAEKQVNGNSGKRQFRKVSKRLGL
ncbi:DUF995 domain-containing protein [Leisingera sp. ANG-M7]|uniref:DUF995 domain-containing protein n=1 Tax=Leisingera sp. ANG-M7 TaxID=1577902 RepID=UPI00057D71E4|nr:DUF995 domain-containing protein [Leisingera sp. ANG-M7]KIC35544.1 hypothetical protein RA26_17485 [Leisingera sp. ANG-M7]